MFKIKTIIAKLDIFYIKEMDFISIKTIGRESLLRKRKRRKSSAWFPISPTAEREIESITAKV